ncbi:MAG: hypothetical protein ACTHJ3_16605 [Pararhizobium sp.]
MQSLATDSLAEPVHPLPEAEPAATTEPAARAAETPAPAAHLVPERAETALELIELELALDTVAASQAGFPEAVAEACRSIGAEFLFVLPASGLAGGFQKLAVVRLSNGADALVLLDEAGNRVSVRTPDESTGALARFADAFVDVLGRI